MIVSKYQIDSIFEVEQDGEGHYAGLWDAAGDPAE